MADNMLTSAHGNDTYFVYDEEECDGPAVFLCGQCRQPLGDTQAWAGCDDDLSQIMLKRVTVNVITGKETIVSGPRKDHGCLIVNLTCRGCSSDLGNMYISTTENLDYKRSLYCFNVAKIDSYVLGSAGQKTPELDKKAEPVTLEYKRLVEKQMMEVKTLSVAMGQRLLEMENNLPRQ